MRNKMNPVALPVALNAQKNTGDALHFAVPGAARIKERKAVAFETATFPWAFATPRACNTLQRAAAAPLQKKKAQHAFFCMLRRHQTPSDQATGCDKPRGETNAAFALSHAVRDAAKIPRTAFQTRRSACAK